MPGCSYCNKPQKTAFAVENVKLEQETRALKATLDALCHNYRRPQNNAIIIDNLILQQEIR